MIFPGALTVMERKSIRFAQTRHEIEPAIQQNEKVRKQTAAILYYCWPRADTNERLNVYKLVPSVKERSFV